MLEDDLEEDLPPPDFDEEEPPPKRRRFRLPGLPDAVRPWLLPLGLGLVTVVAGGYALTQGGPRLDDAAALFDRNPHASMAIPPRGGPESRATALLTPPGPGQPLAAPVAAPGVAPAATEAAPGEVAQTPAPADPQAPAPAGTQDFQALMGGLPTIQPVAAPVGGTGGQGGTPSQPPAREPPPAPKLADIPDRGADQVKPLDKGPASGLTRPSSQGPLPVVAQDGRRAWKVYAGPAKPEPDKRLLAVVVTDVGMADEATAAAQSKLPGAVTVALNPYGRNLERLAGVMRGAGHEVMLMLPMEPPEFPMHDPGPMSVLTRHSPSQAIERLERVMGRTISYVGVAAIAPSPVLVSDVMRPILMALDERGLMFAGAAVNPPSGLPLVQIDLVIDEKPFRAAIEARLKQALELLEKQGRAVLALSATPLGVERLYHFLRELPSTVQLVPVSALARTQEPAKETPGG